MRLAETVIVRHQFNTESEANAFVEGFRSAVRYEQLGADVVVLKTSGVEAVVESVREGTR